MFIENDAEADTPQPDPYNEADAVNSSAICEAEVITLTFIFPLLELPFEIARSINSAMNGDPLAS